MLWGSRTERLLRERHPLVESPQHHRPAEHQPRHRLPPPLRRVPRCHQLPRAEAEAGQPQQVGLHSPRPDRPERRSPAGQGRGVGCLELGRRCHLPSPSAGTRRRRPRSKRLAGGEMP